MVDFLLLQTQKKIGPWLPHESSRVVNRFLTTKINRDTIVQQRGINYELRITNDMKGCSGGLGSRTSPLELIEN